MGEWMDGWMNDPAPTQSARKALFSSSSARTTTTTRSPRAQSDVIELNEEDPTEAENLNTRWISQTDTVVDSFNSNAPDATRRIRLTFNFRKGFRLWFDIMSRQVQRLDGEGEGRDTAG